jgi:hypothetical protein
MAHFPSWVIEEFQSTSNDVGVSNGDKFFLITTRGPTEFFQSPILVVTKIF